LYAICVENGLTLSASKQAKARPMVLPADPTSNQALLSRKAYEALAETARNGLSGGHHYYITFDTTHDGVDVPDRIREKYPRELAIVLQHRFSDLEVNTDAFKVTLWFNDVPERLRVPFDAITDFFDPAEPTTDAVAPSETEGSKLDEVEDNSEYKVVEVDDTFKELRQLEEAEKVCRQAGRRRDVIAAIDGQLRVWKDIQLIAELMGRWPSLSRGHIAALHINRGDLLSEEHDHAEAVAAYDTALFIITGSNTPTPDPWVDALSSKKVHRAVPQLETLTEETWQLYRTLGTAFEQRGNALMAYGNSSVATTSYEAAIQIKSSIRDLLEPMQRWTPEMSHNLASAYMNYGIALNRQDLSEQAVAAYHSAISILTGMRAFLEAQDQWTVEMRHTLARTYMNRGSAQREASLALMDAETAVEHLTDLKALASPRGEWTNVMANDLAGTRINWGTSLSDLGRRAEAIDQYTLAIAISNELRERAEPNGEWTDELRDALARAQVNQAIGLYFQDQLQASLAASMSALRTLRASDIALARYRPILVLARMMIGRVQLRLGDVSAAIMAFESGLAAREYGQHNISTGFEVDLSARSGGVGSLLAWCYLRDNRPNDALDGLERAQASQLRRELVDELRSLEIDDRVRIEALRERVRDLESRYTSLAETFETPDQRAKHHSDAIGELAKANAELRSARKAAGIDSSIDRLSVTEILSSVPENGMLIAPVITDQGGFAFVIPHGTSEVTAEHVVELPGVKKDLLDSWVLQWRAGCNAFADARARGKPSALRNFEPRIDEIIEDLGRLVLNPIVARVRLLGLLGGGVGELVILTSGGIGFLPMHAAPINEDGKCALDEYIVRYTPSLTALRAANERSCSRRGDEDRLMGLFNPEADDPGRTLEFTETMELPAIRTCFERQGCAATIYSGADATVDRLIQEAREYSHLHLSCHATFTFGAPHRSGVVLAAARSGGVDKTKGTSTALLDLRRIANELILKKSKLVCLAACETGMTAAGALAEEQVGMPAAFLQAGAPTVIASLWPVADQSTAIVMGRLYQLHLERGLAPARALREAVLELRDGRLEFSDTSPGQVNAATKFSHSFFWAPYVVVGA